jgi:hypothetical protein
LAHAGADIDLVPLVNRIAEFLHMDARKVDNAPRDEKLLTTTPVHQQYAVRQHRTGERVTEVAVVSGGTGYNARTAAGNAVHGDVVSIKLTNWLSCVNDISWQT